MKIPEAEMIDPIVVQLLQRVNDLEEVMADDLADLKERRAKAAAQKAKADADKAEGEAAANALMKAALDGGKPPPKKKKGQK